MQQQRVGKGHVNTEAEVGFMSPQPKGHKELPEVGKSEEVSTPWGLPRRLSAKEPTCQYKKRRFEPWVRKIPRKRSLVGYSPWDGKRVGHNLATEQQQHPSRETLERVWPC